MEEKYISKTVVDGEEYNLKDEGAARAGELSEEIVNREASGNQLSAELAQKQDTLTESQLAAVNSGIDSAKVAQINENSENISSLDISLDGVEEKIPAQATAENQLADKAFVNSSVQTATANFRGNWANFTAVPTDVAQYPADYAGQKTPTTNDYLVVQDASDFPVAEGESALAGTWRFKYSGEWSIYGKTGWHPEYQVNETPLTAEQLAALNSGITAGAVTKLNGVEAGAEVNDINSISINGTSITPDANKNVDLQIVSSPVKLLTSDDFNYPTDVPTCILIGILPAGTYIIAPNTPYKLGLSSTVTTRTEEIFISVSPWSNAVNQDHTAIVNDNYYGTEVLKFYGNGTLVPQDGQEPTYSAMNFSATENDLSAQDDTAGHQRPLSAYQGAVLKGMIENADTIKTLTAEDYDYPAENPDGVRLWAQPTGVYKLAAGIKVYAANNFSRTVSSSGSGAIGIVTNDGPNSTKTVTISSGGVFGDFVSVNKVGNYGTKTTIPLSVGNPAENRYDYAMSPHAGYVLKQAIGTLSDLTTTDKTSTVAAINELVARVAALEGN